jgi:hypothetical protein
VSHWHSSSESLQVPAGGRGRLLVDAAVTPGVHAVTGKMNLTQSARRPAAASPAIIMA